MLLQAPAATPSTPAAAHPDERQVELDVQRSFAAPWPALRGAELERRREQLHTLILTTLRRYPFLHYYQGFHDVVAVVLLTLCPHCDDQLWPSDAAYEDVQRAVDQISLQYVRDAMATDLSPAIAHVKLVMHIVRAADAPFGYALDAVFAPQHMIAPLPWLLTLMTHDAPSLPCAQRLLDVVWTHGPASALYLSAALVLDHKADLERVAAASARPLSSLDMPEAHTLLAGAPASLHAPATLERVVARACDLQAAYPLTCPAVHAPKVVSAHSALLTWPREVSASTAREMLASRLALDTAPPPVRTAAAGTEPRARVLQPYALLRSLAHMRGTPHLWMYPRVLLLSTLSLLLGSGVLTAVLAVVLAARLPPS